MSDLYTTDTLIGVVQALPLPSSALLDRYFAQIMQDDAEEIHFDQIDTRRRLAPFVAPMREGKIVSGLGYSTKTFAPAYVKDKRVFDPGKPLRRAVGEQIGGTLTPLARRDAYLALEMQDQIAMVTRRLEVMASELIRTGIVTVAGEGYPTTAVNFGRDAALSPAALAGTAQWSDPTSTPIKNLETWSALVRQKSGTNPVDVIMGEDAFAAFVDNAAVQKLLDSRRLNAGDLTIGVEAVEGLTFHGTIARQNIFTYSGTYVDPVTDAEREMFPANQVALASSLLEGVRAFGAIRDGAAGWRAMPYFPKMWASDDPAVEYLMLQSAPLTVARRPNATFGIQVMA